ncbi:hypothetical protein LOTGIDRAFT_171278 [Lottia gigantea]|uniref:Uncharacterized protein n=1 Tax=Lottia gigantea TaxID=225164 RepID=V4BC11_LOTGI|nr:hypothetical protein LOTGIDRAFT_171278 [Lottia gigantea]ESP03627.1 hypothetical protein LOTGIDRAFT_171278 [Lottia gigantea]
MTKYGIYENSSGHTRYSSVYLKGANDHVFLFHRPIKYDSNDISFEDESSQMTQLTILFDEWPTTSSVKMDVFFYDYDDFDHTTVLVDWFETPLQRSVGKGEKQVEIVRGNRQMDKTRLEFKWSVHCFGTNDCLKPPPEWNIWPWAAESRTNGDSGAHGSSYNLTNVSKSMTTVNPTQKKTTVKIFNKNINKQWVEADEEFTENEIRSPFSPFNPHTHHGDILNVHEKLFDAREHARTIDAEERFDVAPARQANHTRFKKINPIVDYHKPINAYKKNHKGLNDKVIERMPAIDDPFATDVPVVRDELLKEIYERVAVELSLNDVKKDTEFSPADPSTRLQTIIAETETKTGALPMPRNPYIDRNGEHIKLPSVDHSQKKEADDNSEDLRRNPSDLKTYLVNTDKTYNPIERTSVSSKLDVESITDPTKDGESFNTNTELPKKIQVKRKHRTKPPTVRKWDKNYNWKEHYKDYVLPKQHLSKVKTHTIVWSQGKSKRPIKGKNSEPVSRTGAKKYPQSSLNQLKEARKNSSIEMGYYRQLHTDFITRQNQKRRNEKAKVKSSKRRTTLGSKIKMPDAHDLSTEKTKKIPINVAPINPFAKKRKPYQATLKLDSGFTDWSKDLRTKLPPVNPSAKGPMAVPPRHYFWSKNTNVTLPNQVKYDIIKSKNTNVAGPNQFNDTIKTTHVGTPDYVEYINSKSISVPDDVKTDIIVPIISSVDRLDNAKNAIIKSKTTNVYDKDDTKSKTASVGISDNANDIINVKNDNINFKIKYNLIERTSDNVKDHIKPKSTSEALPGHAKKDIIKLKSKSVTVSDHLKKDTIKTKTSVVDVPDHVKNNIIKSKTTNVRVPDHIKSTDLHENIIIKSEPTNLVPGFSRGDRKYPQTSKVGTTTHKPFKNKVINADSVADIFGSANGNYKTIDGSRTVRYPINGDVIKTKPTDAYRPELEENDLNSITKKSPVSISNQTTAKTTNGVPQNKKVQYSENIQPLQPPIKSRDKIDKMAKKKKSSDAPNSVSSDSHKVSKVFHENNRSSFSVGPFLPEIDMDERTKTTIHSWYVSDNRLLPETKQSSKRPHNHGNAETRKKTTHHRESVGTKLRKKSKDIMQVKPTKVVVDSTKYIQTSSIKEALEKLNPKKSPFRPKIKPTNSQPKPHQTTQVKTINKTIKKAGEVFISESTTISQKSTPKATVDIIGQATIASFTKASGRDHLVVNIPLPPHINDNGNSGPQIQGSPTAIRPEYSKNPIFNAILTPVPTKTTGIVHMDSDLKSKIAPSNGLGIVLGGSLIVTSGARTQSTTTSITNRFTPKDKGSLFETFKSLSEIIKKASRKGILKTNDTSIIATKVVNNVKKSPFSPNPVERKPIVTYTSSKAPTTIEWIRYLPEQKKTGKTTQSRFPTTLNPMATIRHTPVGPTSTSQSPVIVFPISDVNRTTTVSQMNIFEFLPNAIKEIYFGKAKQPLLGIHNKIHTTASVFETVRSKPTTGGPFASDPNTPGNAITLNNDLANQNKQPYSPLVPDSKPENKGSSDLDILDSLNNPYDHLKNDKNQKRQDTSIPVVPTLDSKKETLNYVYHEPNTKLKGTNFLFNNRKSGPKNPRTTSKIPRPIKPTTRHRRPQFPTLPSHRYFAYTRLGPADAFTTTPATTKRKHRFKLPALPTHGYFAFTRKDAPTTTKHPNNNPLGSLIEHGKVKLVSKPGTEKSPSGFEKKISKHTTKTRFPNSAASKTFNPYHNFRSNTASPRFPTQIGVRKSGNFIDHQTVTKHPLAEQNDGDMLPGKPDFSRTSQSILTEQMSRGPPPRTIKTANTVVPPGEPELSQTSQSILTVQMKRGQSTRTTKTASTDMPPGEQDLSQTSQSILTEMMNRGQSTKRRQTARAGMTNGLREHIYTTKSVNKIGKTYLEPGIKQQKSPKATNSIHDTRDQTVATEATEGIRGVKSIEHSTAFPVTTQHQSLLTKESINRSSYQTTDKMHISTNASHPRSTSSGNAGEASLETDKKVTITSNIFRWIYDLSKSLPEINKPVSKTNNTVNLEAPKIKDNGISSNVIDIKDTNILNPFFNMFFNFTNTITPKTNLTINRTKHISASGDPPPVEELSKGSPTGRGLPSQTKEMWNEGVAVPSHTENEDNRRKIKQQSVPPKIPKSESLEKDRRKTNKPKPTLKSTVTAQETTTRRLKPKKVPKTTLKPSKLLPKTHATSESKGTSSKTFNNVTSKSSNTPKGRLVMTSKPAATIITKVMITHTDEQSTKTRSTTQARTATTKEPTTPKKIQLTIPPWLKITTQLWTKVTDKITTVISTQPTTTKEKTTIQPEKPTSKKPKHTKDKNPTKKPTMKMPQKPTTKKPTTKKPKKTTTKKPTTKKPKKPTTKKPTTKKPKKLTTKKPTTNKPKKPTTKKPKTKATKKVKFTTTISPKKTTNSTTAKTRQSTTKRLPRTHKPVNITINMDPNSNDGPRIIVPNGGLFIPQPRDYNSSSYGYPGGSARLQVRKMNFKTVFNRYWPAILGLTVGTVFLVAAVLTSVACRQQRLYIRRSGWTDMPHHVSEPPDTSEYSSAASLVSDATRSSISFP